MQHDPDEDGVGPDVGAAFADPAFAELKARGAPFAILHPEGGGVLWANAAAAAHWGARDAEGLARALFGADGLGGWLEGLARGQGPRAHTAVIRTWTDDAGRALVGLAVPDVAPPGGDAWRRTAWTTAEPAAPTAPVAEAGPLPEAEERDGEALARRGQLAVLRDRLGRALGGGPAPRLIWRTDSSGALVSIDADVLGRLGAPLRPGPEPWADAVARFDPTGAERLSAALAGRSSWSGVRLHLPVADGLARVPLTLGASPAFGPGRSFAGFRGFGTLDLAGLAPAVRRAAPPEAGSRADDPVEAPAAGAPGPAERAPDEAPEPAARPPANVVQLRAFQGAAPQRAPVPPPPAPEPEAAALGPDAPEGEDAVWAAPPAGGEPPRERGGPQDDQLAFLALGEALRARIGAPPAAPEAERPAGREPAAALLDLLPVPVLVAAGGRPVYANAAAAERLGAAAPAALLDEDLTPSAEADGIALADGRAVPARRVEVAWAGAPAALWLLSEAEPAAEAPPAERASAGEAPAAELLDRVDDAVALLDAAGRVRRLNRRGEGWFARPGAEPPLGHSFADLLAPESRPAALALMGEVRSRQGGLGAPPLRREVAARAGEGEPVPMLLTLGRLGDAGFYATLRDVAALKRAETDRDRTERDRARAAERLPDLLAKVSHEIRTPLGAVLGFAEVMIDERFGPLGNPRYRDYLKDIHAAGTQVVALVEDLLDLSRIEAGQIDLAVAAVDLNRVVSETVAQMQPEAHKERVIMRTSLGGRVPPASADERSARQIVKNLLSNAVKFNEPGGQVIVSTAPGEGGGALLRVRDTGVGMTDEEIASALEPFGTLPARAPTQGNGLGLPLTRALVGANGASMTIRSRPREGTLVEVAFAPAGPDEARQPA